MEIRNTFVLHAHDRDKRHVLVNTVMYLQVPKEMGNFLADY
jgi:hypothetical protein